MREFQKKCLNKMQDVGKQGRTVLFVSHNMPAITRLCQRTILLDEGTVLKDGPSTQVVSAYLNSGFGTSAEREWPDVRTAPGGEVARLAAVRLKTEAGQITDAFDIREPIGIEMEFETLHAGYILLPHHHLHNEEGVHVFTTHDLDPDWRGQRRPAGRSGQYRLDTWKYDVRGNVLRFFRSRHTPTNESSVLRARGGCFPSH